MGYRIWIGCTSDGAPLVGAREGANTAAANEQVWPSQMAHRCTAMRPGVGAIVCTPTEAKREGWRIIAMFPRADGSR